MIWKQSRAKRDLPVEQVGVAILGGVRIDYNRESLFKKMMEKRAKMLKKLVKDFTYVGFFKYALSNAGGRPGVREEGGCDWQTKKR